VKVSVKNPSLPCVLEFAEEKAIMTIGGYTQKIHRLHGRVVTQCAGGVAGAVGRR